MFPHGQHIRILSSLYILLCILFSDTVLNPSSQQVTSDLKLVLSISINAFPTLLYIKVCIYVYTQCVFKLKWFYTLCIIYITLFIPILVNMHSSRPALLNLD